MPHMKLLSIAVKLLNAQQQQNGKTESSKERIRSELVQIVGDSHKLEAAAILLQKIVAKYSAPTSSNDAKIAFNFVEGWGPGGTDVLALWNPGAALEDCTITVELVGIKGESHTNVHFVPKWDGKTYRSARYSQGESVLGETLNRTTVDHPQSVTVFIQSPEFSSRLSYICNPQHQDKHVAAICKNLKLIANFSEKQAILVSQKSVSITMDGVAYIPKGQISLKLH